MSAKKHIVMIMANNSSVPYFTWFAEKAQHDPNFKFSFICLHSEKPSMIEEFKPLGIATHWIYFNNNKRINSMVKAVFALKKLFVEIKPDVVHSHLFDDTLPSMIAAKWAGIKNRVATKQDTTFHWYYSPKGVKYDRLINRLAKKLIAVSGECKDFILEKEKADPKKVVMIHHGVNTKVVCAQTEEFKTVLKNKYGLEGKRVIITIARLIDWKGYKKIIDVAEKVVVKFPEAVFLFVGEGDQKEELENIIKQKKLNKNIILTGWVERSHIPSLYGIADIYFHMANFEPFGFVFAEALVNGVPIVSNPTGAAKDSIENGKNGYLIDYNNVVGAADAIVTLLNADQNELRKNAKQTGETLFTFETMWKNHIELYNSMN